MAHRFFKVQRKKQFTDVNSKVAVQHWIDYYSDTAYRDTNREEVYADALQGFVPGSGKILDIGCGKGVFCKILTQRGYVVTGLDANASELLSPAEQLGFSILEGNILDLEIGTNQYDAISLIGLLEHFNEREMTSTIFPKITQALTDEGVLLAHVPVRSLGTRISRFVRLHVTRDITRRSIDDDHDPTHMVWGSIAEYNELLRASRYEVVWTTSWLHRSSRRPLILSLPLQLLDRFLRSPLADRLLPSSARKRLRYMFAFSYAFIAIPEKQ